MDLALEFGEPDIHRFARRLKESDYRLWAKYAKKRLLPARRLEYYLARVAMLVDITMGGATGVSLSDYLFEDPDQPAEPTLEEVKEAFDFKPIGKKKR